MLQNVICIHKHVYRTAAVDQLCIMYLQNLFFRERVGFHVLSVAYRLNTRYTTLHTQNNLHAPDPCTREDSFDIVTAMLEPLTVVVAVAKVGLLVCPALHFLLLHAFFLSPGPPKHFMSIHSGHFPQFGC